MTQNFIIKKGKKTSYSFLLFLLLLFILNMKTLSNIALILMSLLILILTIPILLNLVMIFRWVLSFAVFLDMDKQEIILNHTLFFRKKRISLNDIKEVDVFKGNIILFASTPLSKWQRIVSKTKKSADYTIRFETIETCERRELTKLLSKWKDK